MINTKTSYSVNRTLWLLLFCIGSSILIGVGIQFDFTITILMTILVISTFFILWKAAVRYLDIYNRDWVRLVSQLIVPAVLWLLFGFGGMLSFFMPEVVTLFGTTYEAATVFLTALYIAIGAIFYVWGFQWGFRNTGFRLVGEITVSERVLMLFLGSLLAFDWYVRFDQIQGGVYFTWLTNYAQTMQAALRTTNVIYQFQNTVTSIILPLLVYAVLMYPKNRLYTLLLMVQSVLIILQGQRRDIVLVVTLIVFSFLALRRFHINRKLLLSAILSVGLFLGIVGPIVEEARLSMRLDARSLVAQPEQILGRYVFEYIPRAISLDRLLGDSDASLRAQQGISLSVRVGAYMSYAANIHQAMIDGRAGPNVEQVGTAISLVIPRYFYRGKPTVDANDMIFNHFGFGRIGFDATGTSVADVFGYLHLPGIVLLFVVVGVGYGLVARHLRRSYGQIGDMIMIGILPSALPMGDAFGAYLASLRNVLILVALIALLMRVYPVLLSERYHVRDGGIKGRPVSDSVFESIGRQMR